MEGGSNSNGGSVNVPEEEAAGGGYKCKTCRKRFDTFQALGGHQGIHKKIDDDANFLSLNILGPVKSSSGSHKCKLCMKVFESGPALGGHMTRHRNGKVAVESSDDDRVMGKVKRLKTEKDVVDDDDDDEEEKKRRELILAAKEWRLWPVHVLGLLIIDLALDYGSV
ncbi:hypothetical protein QVD17_03862 [Tagetes erecta]|uniref:C2H2-type domain-containing protein n=1 Tax=Tagetes erecta TaxID=13708 RepID=A0AAD8L928_TARER|nr:hypothetical protein QVD17_03862 [Tagetes erecta]